MSEAVPGDLYLDTIEYAVVQNAHRLLTDKLRDSATLDETHALIDRLSEWHLPSSVLVAAMLLPLLRLDLASENELAPRFGGRAMHLARITYRMIYYDGVSEPQKRPSIRAAQAEKLRRLFIAAYVDPEAVLICAALRLIGMSHIDQMDEGTRQRWAQDNLAVYLPLLEMLGLWIYHHELANTSLSILDAAAYAQFERHAVAYQKRHAASFEAVAYQLTGLLEDEHIGGAQLALHQATPVGVNRRSQQANQRGQSFRPEENATLRIDLLLDDESDCYRALGVIHKHWRPAHRQPHARNSGLIPSAMPGEGRFFDGIAVPRYNGYRCLTTTILYDESLAGSSPAQKLVEFRIRTHDMERINTYGIVASHERPVSHVWWADKTMADLLGARDTEQFKAEIAVFTPNGEVVQPMPRGCTVIDAAFRIHSASAPYARRFWVNGRQVAEQIELRHRDLIEIEYDGQQPALKPEWEDHARTSSARANIHRFLKRHDGQHGSALHRGRRLIDTILERETGIYQMRFPQEKIDQSLTRIAQDRGFSTPDALYVKVLEGHVSPDEVVAAMIESELVGHILLDNGENWPAERIRLCRCWMQEKESVKWERSSRVLPGCDIVGRRMGKDDHAVLIVHRADCRHAPPPAEAITLGWRTAATLREAAEITITAQPRPNTLNAIMNAISAVGKSDEDKTITIHRMQADTLEGSTHINMVVDAPSFESLHSLQDKLKLLKKADTIADFKIWQLFPGQKMLIAGQQDKRTQNPYTLRQIRDRSMFFGRDEEINRVVECIKEGETFVILYGQKRIGKTSLMVQLAENLLPQFTNVLPVQFDAHSLSPFDTMPFLLGLAEAAKPHLYSYLKRADERKGLTLREADLQGDPFTQFAAWVDRVQKRLPDKKLLFMIDEFTRAEEEVRREKLDAAFFDGMQWLAGNQHVGFLLCVHDNVYRQGSLSWGLLQRGQPIRLGSLDPEAAARLVRQPLERIYKFSDDIVEQILDLTNCHPYFIHAICLELTARLSRMTHDRVTSEDLQSAMSVVLRTGDHYFSHFRSRVDEFAWLTLKTLAYLSGDDYAWVTNDELRSTMEMYGNINHRWQIPESIGELYRSGIIESRNTGNKVAHRIPVKLFQFWLRQGTHPLVIREMQKRE